MNFEVVWKNIQKYEGETFNTIRGKEYNYVVYNDYILINDDKKRRIKKQCLKTAVMIENPTPKKIMEEGIWGPSYVYGIIIDKRIMTP
ncbi:MAG: hypothetical protein IKV21_04240 [Clostridia bacterium]|nr:hypothetical protein [Clostridia bacterium]